MAKTLIKATPTGIKTTTIKEYGFTGDSFKRGNFYDIEDLIEDLANKKKEAKPVEIIEPAKLEDIPGVQIGSVENKELYIKTMPGMFCEKPCIDLEGSENIYYFPLGSEGDYSAAPENCQGFSLKEYQVGGKLTGKETLGNSPDIPIKGSLYNGSSFREKSLYDRNCWGDYRGKHITTNNPNLAKYTQVSEDSTTIEAAGGSVTSHTLSNASTILGVDITYDNDGVVETLKGGTDYTCNRSGKVTITKIFKKDTKLTVRIRRHNYWISNNNWYNVGNLKEQISRPLHNFLETEDAMTLRSSTNDKNDYVYHVGFSVSKADWYIVSLYAKCNTESWLRGIHIYAEGSNANQNIRVDSVAHPYQTIVEKSINTREVAVASKGTNYSNTEYEINPTWRRYASASYLEPGDYKMYISWPAEHRAVKDATLSIMGVCVEESHLSDYSSKVVNYTYLNDNDNKRHLMSFMLPNANKNIFELTDDWVISYSRYVSGFKNSNVKYLDSIGSLTYGYEGDNIVVGGKIQNVAGVKASDMYNSWERVIVKYHASKKAITLWVRNEGFDHSPAKEYTIEYTLTDTDKKDSSIKDDKYNITYNIMLGAYVNDKGEAITADAMYRGLWWCYKGLSDRDLNLLKNSYLSYKVANRVTPTYEDSYDDNNNLSRSELEKATSEENILLRSEFLQEEYSN